MGESFEVGLKGSGAGRTGEPPTQLVDVGGGQGAVADRVDQCNPRAGPHAAIKVVVQQPLGRAANTCQGQHGCFVGHTATVVSMSFTYVDVTLELDLTLSLMIMVESAIGVHHGIASFTGAIQTAISQ